MVSCGGRKGFLVIGVPKFHMEPLGSLFYIEFIGRNLLLSLKILSSMEL